MTGKAVKPMLFRCFAAGLLFLAAAALGAEQARHAGGMNALFLAVFGGVDNRTPSGILGMLLLRGLPTVFFLYVFGTVFHRDFLISFVYKFTRLNSRGKWLRGQAFSLAAQFLAAWLIAFALVYGYGALYGLQNNLSAGFLAVLFLTNFLSCLVLAFLQNCLSIWWGETASFFAVLVFYVLSLLLGAAAVSAPFVLYLLPPVNGMYLWHEALFALPPGAAPENLAVAGFVFWKSFAACLVWLGLLYGAALHRIKHCDLLEIGKEG